MEKRFTFKGGFGVYEAEYNGNYATIRVEGFGRIKRYKLWIDGGLPRGQFNTFEAAKSAANSAVLTVKADV